MATPADLRALAAKCAAAEGADRTLDVDIAQALGWTVGGVDIDFGWMSPSGRTYSFLPDFTASVDAVLALIGERLAQANCYGFDRHPRGTTGYVSRNCVASGHWLIERDAATPALALLAAALESMAVEAERVGVDA